MFCFGDVLKEDMLFYWSLPFVKNSFETETPNFAGIRGEGGWLDLPAGDLRITKSILKSILKNILKSILKNILKSILRSILENGRLLFHLCQALELGIMSADVAVPAVVNFTRWVIIFIVFYLLHSCRKLSPKKPWQAHGKYFVTSFLPGMSRRPLIFWNPSTWPLQGLLDILKMLKSRIFKSRDISYFPFTGSKRGGWRNLWHAPKRRSSTWTTPPWPSSTTRSSQTSSSSRATRWTTSRRNFTKFPSQMLRWEKFPAQF